MKYLPWKGRGHGQVTRLEFYTPCNISATAKAGDFKFCTLVGHAKSYSCDEWVFPKWAWSGLREQFLHCRHRKSSVYRWFPQQVRGLFVYDTYETMEATRSRHGWVNMFITHRPTVTLQLHNFDLFRTCRTNNFCAVAWQLARFRLTRRIARSLGDSWASCWMQHPQVTYEKLISQL